MVAKIEEKGLRFSGKDADRGVRMEICELDTKEVSPPPPLPLHEHIHKSPPHPCLACIFPHTWRYFSPRAILIVSRIVHGA